MQWSFGAAVGLAAAMAFAGPALAAVDAYLQLEGVKGESQDDRHKDWIEVSSFNTGAHGSGGGGGAGKVATGRGGGGPAINAIQITKPQDRASPGLMRAASTGQRFAHATLDVRQAGKQSEFMQYKLTDVMVSSYHMSSGGDRPTETLTLTFGKIDVAYHPQTQGAEGSRGMVPSSAHLPPPGHPN